MASRAGQRQKTKDPAVGERLRRLVRMLGLLERGVAWSRSALAEQLKVSERTVYRDIQLLNEENLRISYDRECGGYRLHRADPMNLPPLTPEELAALLQAGESGGLVLSPSVAEYCKQVASKHLGATSPVERVLVFELVAKGSSELSMLRSQPSIAKRSDIHLPK